MTGRWRRRNWSRNGNRFRQVRCFFGPIVVCWISLGWMDSTERMDCFFLFFGAFWLGGVFLYFSPFSPFASLFFLFFLSGRQEEHMRRLCLTTFFSLAVG